MAPAAASEQAWRYAWGTTVRTGGRSSSPVMASWQPAASTVRSVAGQAALGPESPNAVIDTVTSAGLAARSTARSTGGGPEAMTTSAPAANRSTAAMPSAVVRSAMTLRLPRFQAQKVKE